MKQLPFSKALGYIVASIFLTTCLGHGALRVYFKQTKKQRQNPEFAITHIIQTGPQKEALKTDYLAELLGLSENQTLSSLKFDTGAAEKKLLKSPLIQQAHIKVLPPHALYIDYVVRQPVAWLYDYHNVVIDKQGTPFPFTPFFAPKHLPEIYLGGNLSLIWGYPLEGKQMQLALDVLKVVQDPKIREFFPLKRIDVSHAFTGSLGTREIVLIVEDEILQKKGLQEVRLVIPRILRLSLKRYPEELGNYLKLREKLLSQEVKRLINFKEPLTQPVHEILEKTQVIDFRLQNLAFIQGDS